MARFVFQLEPLLKARKAVEQRKQLAVAELERERRTLEDRLRAQQESITAGKHALRVSLIGSLEVHALRSHAASTMRVMKDAQRMVIELAGVHKRLENARAELIEATKQRRAVELIREQRYEAWKRVQEKAETNAMDELAVIAAARTPTEPEVTR